MTGKNLFGAIIGDVVGSRFEGRGKTIKTKNFPLFGGRCRLTDDTVMTIAVADALLTAGTNIEDADALRKIFVAKIKDWGLKYPRAGYGRQFSHWLASGDNAPYNSFGNGAAMRVSAVAHFYDDIDYVRRAARLSAEVTHNHPEGVKGAESVAAAIFLARSKTPKAKIKSYVEENFGYDLSRTLENIRPFYRHETAAAKSVPESIIAFLESENFEDAIRNAVSLGGDSDTLAAIAGSIAGAFYGVPDDLAERAEKKLSREIVDVLGMFNYTLTLQEGYAATLQSTRFDKALANFNGTHSPESRKKLFDELRGDRSFIIPLRSPDSTSALMSCGLPPFRDMSSLFLTNRKTNETVLVALTDFRELAALVKNFDAGFYFRIIDREDLLKDFLNDGVNVCSGILVDPGRNGQIILTEEIITEILG